jgi:four helix bundle protein
VEVKSFRELRVWHAAMELALAIYDITTALPTEERYGLTSQLRRSAVSVPSNIAEGHTREGTREYLYFISVAQASLAEVMTQLDLAARLGYLTANEVGPCLDRTASLGRQLFALRDALKQRK